MKKPHNKERSQEVNLKKGKQRSENRKSVTSHSRTPRPILPNSSSPTYLHPYSFSPSIRFLFRCSLSISFFPTPHFSSAEFSNLQKKSLKNRPSITTSKNKGEKKGIYIPMQPQQTSMTILAIRTISRIGWRTADTV